MNVLLTARQPSGGIRTFFRYVYGNPLFRGIKLTLVAPDTELSDYLFHYIPKEELQFIPISHSNKELYQVSRKLLSSGEFQLLHSHGFTAGVVSELARFGMSTPHLMTAHDVFRPNQFEGAKGTVKRQLLNSLYKRIDAIHTVTEDARQNLLQFLPRLNPDKVCNILHGVETHYFANGTAQDLRRDLDLPADRPLIGFFGRFMAQKGFRTLVDAMSLMRQEGRLEPMPMVLTFGWGGYIREDYEYLASKGLSDCFHQMPATDAMPDMLKSVDMVAMPSRWEACGLLAMEALASGAPLIATNCVGLREVLEGTPARVVSPQDASALAAEIVSEAQKPSRERFAAYQPEAVARFAIDRPVRELLSLYGTVARR